jgi:hypothetical protein
MAGAYLRNSSTATLIDPSSAKIQLEKMCSFSGLLQQFRDSRDRLRFASSANVHLSVVLEKRVGGPIADASVSTRDNDDASGKVRTVLYLPTWARRETLSIQGGKVSANSAEDFKHVHGVG